MDAINDHKTVLALIAFEGFLITETATVTKHTTQ
jgi:hypothetical protein